jgi:hypothetical protein
MNFKKCTPLFLAFLMLVSNSGLAFNVHFCGDEIASISLKMAEKPLNLETNCCGIAEEESNCCNDKSFQIQETSDKFQENITKIEFNAIVVETQNKFEEFFEKPNFKDSKASIFYPFLDNLPPIYKRNCQLIFYA